MRRHILSLDEKLALKEGLTGGKGIGLARLRQFGFPVPPGFVISAPAFKKFLSRRISATLDKNPAVNQETLEQIRNSIIDSNLPPRLRNSIERKYKKLGGRVAVRSSLIGEDSSAGSFAGQLDTVLDVEGEEFVIQAVKKCLSSCFNWRLWKYMTEKNFNRSRGIQRQLSIAVIIQRMIQSVVAGVAFSAHPMTGAENIIIEAALGRGDNVVKGQVEPHRYVLDGQGNIQDMECPNPDPVLKEPDIEKLAALVHDVTICMGGPQDIEWAFDGENFFILQSRPITTIKKDRIYSCKLVSDMCPGLIKPLLWSTKYRSMIRNVFERLFRELLGPIELDFARLIIRIRSRVYADMTGFGDLLGQTGLPSNFFEMMTREEKPRERRSFLDIRKLPALLRLSRICWRYSRSSNEISHFIETHNKDLDFYRQTDWSKETPAEILEHFDSLLDLHGKSQWYVFIGPMNMTIRNKLISRMVERSAAGINPSSIISGLVNLKALEPNTVLQEIAEVARSLDPEVKTILDQGTEKEIRETLFQSQKGQGLVNRVDDFLKSYGFLSANGSDFSEMPWIENPIFVWRSIGRLASLPVPTIKKNVERLRDENLQYVRKNLGVLRRLFFDRLLRSTTKYIQLREQTSFLMSEETSLMRSQLLSLARYLVADRKIEKESDIFYLYYDELYQLVGGSISSETARERIAERSEELEEDAKIDLPVTITGSKVPEWAPPDPCHQEYLTGISVSPGKVLGYARIIRDPTSVEETLKADDILIVPFTDVGWTPLLPGVGGIVAETGGLLSHTAIIAREYELPAVVNVHKATHMIKDGQPLTVDGDTGRVYMEHIEEI
jgi:pyruvate,water dikinase